ncbi:MAG: hypothetical protein GDYSWBUE_002044 [Candidatus Fervidibacterota bacterium]
MRDFNLLHIVALKANLKGLNGAALQLQSAPLLQCRFKRHMARGKIMIANLEATHFAAESEVSRYGVVS